MRRLVVDVLVVRVEPLDLLSQELKGRDRALGRLVLSLEWPRRPTLVVYEVLEISG